MNSAYWKEGESYHKTAIGAQKRKRVFTPEILYNLLSMAIEKYFMAFFESHKTMPDNHTFSDFIFSANQIVPMETQLVEDLEQMEKLQQICSVHDNYQRSVPEEDEIAKLYNVAERVKAYCGNKQPSPRSMRTIDAFAATPVTDKRRWQAGCLSQSSAECSGLCLCAGCKGPQPEKSS